MIHKILLCSGAMNRSDNYDRLHLRNNWLDPEQAARLETIGILIRDLWCND